MSNEEKNIINDWLINNNIDAVSIVDGNNESFFNWNGCEVLDDGACDVYECEALYKDDNGAYKTIACYLAHETIAYIYNGD